MNQFQALKNLPAVHPCWNCNGVGNWGGEGDWHWIECTACHTRGPRRLDPPDAKAAWNALASHKED